MGLPSFGHPTAVFSYKCLRKKNSYQWDHPFSWCLKAKWGVKAQVHAVFVTKNSANNCRRNPVTAAHTSAVLWFNALEPFTWWQVLKKEEGAKTEFFFSPENSFTHSILSKTVTEGTAAETHENFTEILEMFDRVTEPQFHILAVWNNFATWSPESWAQL